MTTFLVILVISYIGLEAVCAYSIYKKRYLIQRMLQRYLGIDDLHDRAYQLEASAVDTLKIVRRIRRHQRNGV